MGIALLITSVLYPLLAWLLRSIPWRRRAGGLVALFSILGGLSSAYYRFGAIEYRGQVTAVLDGQTLEAERDGDTLQVRLAAIQVPEPGQPFAAQTKAALLKLAQDKPVRALFDAYTLGPPSQTLWKSWLEPVAEGKLWFFKAYRNHYGQIKAQVAAGTVDLSAALVKLGLAKVPHGGFTEHTHQDVLYRPQREAQEARRGLWSIPHLYP